jgi:hypothetical protein
MDEQELDAWRAPLYTISNDRPVLLFSFHPDVCHSDIINMYFKDVSI